jgi:hypothetical protein
VLPSLFHSEGDKKYLNLKGDFLDFCFFCTLFNTASSVATHIPLVSEVAEIEPRTLALIARCSNHSARSHQLLYGAFPDCGPLAEDSAAKLKKSQLNVCTVYCVLFLPCC